MPVRVKCANPECGKPLVIPDSARGKRIKCPSCGTALAVPQAQQPGDAAQTVRCPSCLADLPANAVICTNCGLNLKTGGRVQVALGAGSREQRSGVSLRAALQALASSSAKWLLLAAVAIGVAGYFVFLRKSPEQSRHGAPSAGTFTPAATKQPAGTHAPGVPGKTGQPPTPPPPPPPPVEEEDFTLTPTIIRAIGRWDTIAEPFQDEYLARLRGIFEDAGLRLVEHDKADWRFEVSMPEQPGPKPGLVLAQIEGEARIKHERPTPGRTAKLIPLPSQRLWVPWYYVFQDPKPSTVRILCQKLRSASFELSREGGRVSLAGQELEVPAGAVPDGTKITLRYPYEDADHPRTANLLHRLKVEIEPANVTFAKPAALRLVTGRVRGAGRVFQGQVMRRGAKLPGKGETAAVLPGGATLWAPDYWKLAFGWDPAVGIGLCGVAKPEPGWVEVPLGTLLRSDRAEAHGWGDVALEEATAKARAKRPSGIPLWKFLSEPGVKVLGWEKHVETYVGPRERLIRNIKFQYDGSVYRAGPALTLAIKTALANRPPIVLRVTCEDGAGSPRSRTVDLAAAVAEAEPRGDLRDAKFCRSAGSHTRSDTSYGVRVIGEVGGSQVIAPPHVTVTLACRPPAGDLTANLTTYFHEVPLECLLYRLGDAQVATGISLRITDPGIYSVAVESDAAAGAGAD